MLIAHQFYVRVLSIYCLVSCGRVAVSFRRTFRVSHRTDYTGLSVQLKEASIQ